MKKIYKAAQEGYYRAGDVAEIMGISQSRAYKIIAAMFYEGKKIIPRKPLTAVLFTVAVLTLVSGY